MPRVNPAVRAAIVLLAIRSAIASAAPPAIAASAAQIEKCQQLIDASQARLQKGLFEDAEKLCDEAIELSASFPPPDTHLSRAQMQLGETLRAVKKRERAEQAFKDAIVSCEKAVGPNDIALVDPLESLANYDLGPPPRLDEVASLYRRILTITQHAAAHDDREIARRARNLADVETQRGRSGEADVLYQTALAAAEKNADELPYYLLNAADFYRAAAKYERAESLARRVVAIREKAASADPGVDAQLDLRVALTCLANVELASGKAAQAEPIYVRTVSLAEKIGGVNDPDVAPRLLDLAGALCAQQKYQAAVPHYRRALALTENGVGRDTAEVADILEKYAAALTAAGQPDTAKAPSDRAAAIRKRLDAAPGT